MSGQLHSTTTSDPTGTTPQDAHSGGLMGRARGVLRRARTQVDSLARRAEPRCAPRTIVITGASSGIGAEAARILSGRGHRLILVGRDPEKTARIAAELSVPGLVADYADLESIPRLAAEIAQLTDRIDVLCNNAGGIFADRELSTNQLPMAYQVNFLAGWLLTEWLRPQLSRGLGLVVNTASIAARMFSDLDQDDIQGLRADSQAAYGNGKLLNILHAQELSRRLAAEGIFGVSFHPGVIASQFAHTTTNPLRRLYDNPVAHRVMTSPAVGGRRLAFLAESTVGVDVMPGQYSHHTRRTTPPDQATSPEMWEAVRAQAQADVQALLPQGWTLQGRA
ncbi:short-chain dehydrogenase [Corynebacterium sp. 13CS0277]|uniref:SDR family NAD(P)-dependent oxidoreductase n=1 Tax=Corynebacterium sp. 13CS0277 TaxID=2071994 RepID=UPI000D04293C|nr:SDR family NAD(P)-dependent oxidoreductase [Corynebacterium sp. 13CS0277]PRQ11414.1 short-chain dehydrogenase [Corynebacterium sp. 13CS0277]